MKYVLRNRSDEPVLRTPEQWSAYNQLAENAATLTGFGYGAGDDKDQSFTDVAMADKRIPDFYGLVILPSGQVVDQRRYEGKSGFNKFMTPIVPYIMAAGAAAATGGASGLGTAAAGAAGGIASSGIRGGSGLEMTAGGVGGYVGGELAGTIGGMLGSDAPYLGRYLALLKQGKKSGPVIYDEGR